MATHGEIQDIIQHRFIRPEILDEATLAAGASISCKDVDGNVEGNKPLALIGDALIRLDVAARSYARGTGTRKDKWVGFGSSWTDQSRCERQYP